jgi:hypothetical protein
MTPSALPDSSPVTEWRPTIFIDRNSGGKKLREFLEPVGITLILHQEYFGQRSEIIRDHDWLEEVGDKGWMVITGDKKTTRDPLFLSRLKNSTAHVFILLDLIGGSPLEQANRIVEKYGLMASAMKKTRPPAIWRIGQNLVLSPCDFLKILGRRGKRPMPPS